MRKIKSTAQKLSSESWARRARFCIIPLVLSIFIVPGISFSQVSAEGGPVPRVFVGSGMQPTPPGMVRKQQQGEVGAKNFNGIAIIYERDPATRSSKELWMNFEEGTYLEGYANYESIEEGDEIRLTYDEDEEQGIKILRGISLVRKAPVEVEEYDPIAEAEA